MRRIRLHHHKTLERFSEECGVHLQALYLTEQGVYPHVLPKIMQYLTHLGYVSSTVEREYTAYVQIKRQAFGSKYDLASLTDLGAPTPDQPPVEVFREKYGLSRMALAKELCVHPASLYKLEMGTAVHLPEQMVAALHEAGMRYTIIAELNFRTEEYYGGLVAI